ncbi:hypothetical protein [Rhodopirellula bahusiensis]|nr:hypothetical protein [Rhodopirellula bahusiensis]
MTDAETSAKLTWVIRLLAANLIVMVLATSTLLFGLLPKAERGIQTAERMEARFQSFADEVQPVLSTSADKAMETIKKMDADRLSKTATEKTDSLLDAAAERTKRLLNQDIDDDQ